MKKILLLAVFTTGILFANAQTSIGLKYGSAMPGGEFKDDGWADNGFTFELTGNFYINEGIAITTLFRTQGNSIDEATFRNELINDPSLNYRYEVEGWGITNLFAGISTKLALDTESKIFLTGRLTGGLLTAAIPEIDVTMSNPNNGSSARVISSSESGSGLGYLVGVGLTYNASDLIDIVLNVDQTGGNVEFEDVTTTANYSDGTSEMNVSSTDQSFSSTLISVGIDFKF